MRTLPSCLGLVGGLALAGLSASASAQPIGSEFQVNTYTTSSQTFASVAADADGNFVVVWHSFGQDGSGRGVFGQRFDSDGVPQGKEFQVNSYATGSQETPAVAADASGHFVVVWQGDGSGGCGGGVLVS